MDMQADLSVDKIEIVPGDIAQSMVSSDQNQNIELETVKKKKKKTKKVDKPQAIPEWYRAGKFAFYFRILMCWLFFIFIQSFLSVKQKGS